MKITSKKYISDPTNYYDLSVPETHAFVLANGLVVHNTGVGYSVQKHHIENLPEVIGPKKSMRRFLIGDSIEGWADAVKVLVKSYFHGKSRPDFDFRGIRPKGARLITSGGRAPGPGPLMVCLAQIESILCNAVGRKLNSIEVHDIQCHIADAVLAGGIRRAAMISLFSLDDQDMLLCKSGEWWEHNPQRGRANNSAMLLRGHVTEDQFKEIWQKVELSGAGEPGFYWTNDLDWGTNPCVEIGLRLFQFCNLCEINFSSIVSQEDFEERVRAATFIGTLQATYTNFHYLRPIWKETTEKDALIGVSGTGIASEHVDHLDLEAGARVCIEENKRAAELLGIRQAARTTCVKPAGCLDPETVIKTSKGDLSLRQIFELNDYEVSSLDLGFHDTKEEIFVYDKNGEPQLITKLFNNGVVETLDVEFEDGLVVSCTPNHKFLTNKGWVRADKLTVDCDLPIRSIKKGSIRQTLDIEVANTHSYSLSNGVITHNTTSLALGTSSGIHSWHAKHYIRRVRVGVNEGLYRYLKDKFPALIEDCKHKPGIEAVVSFPQCAPEGAITRDENVMDFLTRVKRFNLEWVRPGHVDGANPHNVSCTISVKENEWNVVGDWLWDNRDCYTGVSVLPYDGGTYVQAPFEDCDQDTFTEMYKMLEDVDLTQVVETDIDINHTRDNAACAGGFCEI